MRRRILGQILVAGSSLLGMNPISNAAASFLGLGTTPDGYRALPEAISGDGTTVVGFGSHTPPYPFRWTLSGGFETLCCWAPDIRAQEVSADGTYVVGVFFLPDPAPDGAYIWTSTGGMTALGYISEGHLESSATGVSADGTIVVGRGADDYGDAAFRWTSSGGMQGLGVPRSRAWDISANGLVIVGSKNDFNLEAFRWTANDGAVGLGDLPGGIFRSEANATSADGSVVVGYGTIASNFPVAFRWTSADGMVSLGVLTGMEGSRALGVSGDGSVVVGESTRDNVRMEAWVWTKAGGMQRLYDVLINAGATIPTGWILNSVQDISTDGRQVTGRGYYTFVNQTEGFIATLPTGDWDNDSMADAEDNCILAANPSQLDADGDGYGNICDADLNNSGLTTTADFGLIRSVLNQPASASDLAAAADINGSGTVTAADFSLLRARLNTAPGPSGPRP